jgi:hypothetical protein
MFKNYSLPRKNVLAYFLSSGFRGCISVCNFGFLGMTRVECLKLPNLSVTIALAIFRLNLEWLDILAV